MRGIVYAGMSGDEVVGMIKTERPDLRKVVIVREVREGASLVMWPELPRKLQHVFFS